MQVYILPLGIVCGIALVSAAILAYASKVMAVEEDERFPLVRAALPGVNCGACGYSGCDGYAHALIEGSTKKTNLCIPGGGEAARQLSEELGLPFEEVQAICAHVACQGRSEYTSRKMKYVGPATCRACKTFYDGQGKCAYGCMGLGDCVRACPNGALELVDGVPKVHPGRCIGCKLCEAACPNHVIKMVPTDAIVVPACNSNNSGIATNKACKIGCIGCKRCERACLSDAIHVVNNLAIIDYEKCTRCGACIAVCPRMALTRRV